MINLIIVVQRFSPFDKVGARRWSKFVHYLQKNENLKIHVITQEHFYPLTNPWNIEIDPEKVRITYLKNTFSFIKKKLPIFNRITDFIQYKILHYTDEGYGFSKKAFRYLEKEIRTLTPDVIIASSPAYSTCYFASKFKIKFPQVKLINDYRDAWIDGFFSWNKTLNTSNLTYKRQVEMELFSLNNCDAVVSVTPELLQNFKAKIINPKVNTVLITNGYDKRDLKEINLVYPSQFDKTKINICHFGTLDFGRDDEFFKFINSIQLPENFVFYLIGTISDKLKNMLIDYKNIIQIKQLAPNTLSSFLFYADFHLVINDPEFYYAYGSKIFDAILYSKPIIYISKENSLIDKCKNNTGFFYSNTTVSSNNTLIDRISSYKHIPNEMPAYHEFDIELLTKNYYKLISEEIKNHS